jgi:hypothetical protein
VEAADGSDLAGLDGFLREYVSEAAPVGFADQPDQADAELSVTVQSRELPENEFGIVFVFAHAVVSGTRDGENVLNYRTPEVKEGGLDAAQALSRAAGKLQEHLDSDAQFRSALESFARGN